jgi:hypothetical protein
MKIPKRGLEKFVRTIVDDCLTSVTDRINRGAYYKNYALFGAEQPASPAMYNKTYAYLDDLESLLYSPVSLRFHIGDPDLPNILTQAKGRAASGKLRTYARRSNTDTMMSEAVFWSLIKGKTFVKQMWKRGGFVPALVQPEAMGVLHENHSRLDEDMEAFVHSSLITPYQFTRLIARHPNRAQLEKKAQKYMRENRNGLSPTDGAQKQVIVGGLYPFQPAGGQNPNQSRGIVDWMGGPNPVMAPRVIQSFMQLDEAWIWDDDRDAWATFQIVGDDMLIWGDQFIGNIMAWNTESLCDMDELKRQHPFSEFCPNRSADYFWGRSEIVNVCLLQEAINSRLAGINRMLRLQEDPPTYFKMSQGVNQVALSRFNKPGGFWNDASPNADMKKVPPEISKELWGSLHEYERMFDEMGGLPPIAKGHGEAGVRSAGHAETLVRMFTPRFKDRALLIERDVEEVGALMVDLCKVHDPKKMIAWLPQELAGAEGVQANPLIIPPAEGLVAVPFSFHDLDDDSTVTIDSHSSSPAFQAEAKSLVFDLLKIGAMGPEDVVEHVDIGDPGELEAGIMRRRIAAAKAQQEEKQMKLVGMAGGRAKH